MVSEWIGDATGEEIDVICREIVGPELFLLHLAPHCLNPHVSAFLCDGDPQSEHVEMLHAYRAWHTMSSDKCRKVRCIIYLPL